MYTSLIKHIQKYIHLNEDAILSICEHFTPITLACRDYLSKAGQVCPAYYFVSKGCLRMYYCANKGEEQIIQFAIENWWLADYNSILNNKASDYNIQAVEASEILLITPLALEQLAKEMPVIDRYFRIIAQGGLAASQHRTKLMFNLSKEEMYVHFVTAFPAFNQRIPQ